VRWLVAAACVLTVAGVATLLSAGGRTVDTHGATVVHERVHSALLDRDLEQVVVLPKGFSKTDRRGLLVLLHGRGDSPAGRVTTALLTALAAAGPRAPVVLIAHGGEASYYHDRADGPWVSYLSEELIPATVSRFRLDGSRIAYAGISMGGFGALELVRQSGERQCGVAAMAPALWDAAAKTPAGAFDDPDDFAAHDVLGAVSDDPSALHGTPVLLMVGEDDPFREATAALADALEHGPTRVEHVVAPGGHDGAFWEGHTDEVVAWLSEQLARC
jgi:S-formylglutathione hydrolase FrmB